MSAEQTIWGLRVYLDTVETEDTTIGLYTSGTSELRWIEAPVAGTAVAWKSGILIPNGISPIREDADLSRGGNIATVKPMTITIDDTAQFWKTIEDIDVYLNGLRAEVWEFVYDYGTSTLSSESAIHRGALTVERWGVQQYRIGLEYPYHKRRANILTQVDTEAYPDASGDDVGVTIPATFGELAPVAQTAGDITRYAKLVRVASREVRRVNTSFGGTMTPEGIFTFPVINPDESSAPTLIYDIATCQTYGTASTADLTGMYLCVVEGTGKGQYRRIASSLALGSVMDGYRVTIDSYFPETLQGNDTATATDQSWVWVLDVAQAYMLDAWACRAFLDTSTDPYTEIANPDATGVELYTYASRKTVEVDALDSETPVTERPVQYTRLPDTAYVEDGTGDNSRVDIDLKQFNGDTTQADAFTIIPVSNAEFFDGADMSSWGDGDYLAEPGYAGSYIYAVDSGTASNSGTVANVTDRDSTSKYSHTYSMSQDDVCQVAIVFDLPEPPNQYDSVFLAVKAAASTDASVTAGFAVKWKRFAGGVTQTWAHTGAEGGSTTVDSLPDWYFTDEPSTNNRNFYFKENTSGGDRTGYAHFELGLNVDQYKSVHKMLFVAWVAASANGNGTVDTHEIAVVFRTKSKVDKAIYTPAKGRIYNDTWGTRKTAADMISDYVDVYEHVCRLQNWSDAGDTSVSYGKEYSASALINTGSGDGGLGNTRLTEPREYDVAWQVLKYADGWTDKLKRRLCKLMFCVGYVDESGQECLAYLPHTEDSVTDSITLADMPEDMPPGDVEEPDPSAVYCEPFVHYAYNPASGEYDGYIGVNNVHNGTWESAFTPGYSAAEGEEIYDIIHENLWDRYRFIEEPPSDLTNRPEIKTAEDAKQYLRTWVAWMLGKRIPVAVYYGLAKTWHVGRHVNLTLPHQTNGVAKECVIESITKDKNRGVCPMKLIILNTETIDIGDYYIQKVDDNTQPQWDKTHDSGDPQRDKVA